MYTPFVKPNLITRGLHPENKETPIQFKLT